MANYRYLLGDVLNRPGLLGEVPFTKARYSHVLNAPGAFQGTLALSQPDSVMKWLPQALVEGRTSIWVERDGVIVWGGMLWGREADLDDGTLTLSGEGWHSYFRRRTLRARKVYVQQDQTSVIAKDLLAYAQAQAGGDIGVWILDVAASGVLRDRTYEAFERKNIGEAVEQLAAVDNGFDFRYESVYDQNGNTAARFLTQYPATGRHTEFVWEVGTQLASAKIKTDGTSLAWGVDAIGAGEGDLGLIATVYDMSQLGLLPLLDDVVSFTDVTDRSTLEGHARKRLARGRTAIVIPEIKADPSMVPVVGSYLPGDIVRVRGGYGLAAVDDLFRLTEYTVDVDDSGGELVSPTFASLEVF